MAGTRREVVLVVDDDSDWRDILADHLESAGFSVAVASDGFVAWTHFLRSEPLVVVTDVQMPVMDGRELLAKIRGRNFRVPVVLVTGCEALAKTGEMRGAYLIVPKPADPAHIVAAVQAAVSHRASSTALQRLWLAARSLVPAGAARRARWARRRRVTAVSLIVALLGAVAVAARLRRSHGWAAIRRTRPLFG